MINIIIILTLFVLTENVNSQTYTQYQNVQKGYKWLPLKCDTICILLPLDDSALLTPKIPKCSEGFSYMPSMSTSSLSIIADTCLPDSIAKKMWIAFFKNVCGETSFSMSNGDYSYSSLNTWNDSTGCSTKVMYERRIKKKWVEISEEEYYKYNPRPIEIIISSDSTIIKEPIK